MDETKPETKIEEKPVATSAGKNKMFIGLVVLLVAVTLAAAGFAFYYYQKFNTLKADPQSLADQETQALINRVSQIIVLPTNEQPTIATVADPSQLQDQPFFAKAKQGDKVLIYTNARKAILYDPVLNKIVEVAPLSIGNSFAGGTSPTPPAPAPTPAKKK
jgi:uncharacterized protein HemX